MTTDSDQTYKDRSKPERYSSFLLRCWHVGEGELRIKLEHIQSGNSTQVNTFEAAVTWLSEHCAAVRDRKEGRSRDGARSRSEPRASKETNEM